MMKYKNILDCKSHEEFREWLNNNHLKEDECWIECKRGKIRDDDVFYYIDAVYTALCFGWIDSTYGLKDGVRLQRFTPRRKNSSWSELNKQRCRWLIKQNLMTPAGYEVLPELDDELHISADILELLKNDPIIWKNFNKFPDLYKRIRIGNIEKERKRKEVFNKSLNNFLKKTKENKMYGNWNDYGRLEPINKGSSLC